ncbi:uncharacterized protein BDW43DRAFT_296660 [Aspergillus alliaceus]|uniref:uncharacterized protein n=1 Tax=Petromyces alliaceus TaxID=209559 RepID=UPI0012A4CF7E|nr:uncharacterized protein BDW43DRAFT_296660 [Aspergillus alliaceus]KAB8238387.1 hypothetical protein BDW43DRAFT_296660 [Aspergillus alliaceus]
MIFAHILGLSLLGSVNAATLGKRFSSADFAIGETDPHVSSECTYWANSIKSTDTCAALERYYGISNAHLNPSLQATDYTLSEGWSCCVEASAIATTTKTTTSEKTTTTTKAPATTPSNFTTASATKTTVGGPSPTQTGLISSCNAFYYVQKDDSCWAIAVKTNCSGLQLNYYVCVGAVGSTAPIITSKTATASPTTTTAPHSPQQSGISSDCMLPTFLYISHTCFALLKIPIDHTPGNNYYFVEAGDECAFIAAKHGIALRSTCGSLQAGYWVCIGVSATTAKTTTGTAPASTGLSPTQSGIVTDCSAYYQAQGGDDSWSIVNKKYSYLTAAKFYEWNPAIGTSCSNLQTGYYYCVATKNKGPMPNAISTCAKWHLVAYAITSTQFGSWNPYVGSSCATLWQGYYVCVGV